MRWPGLALIAVFAGATTIGPTSADHITDIYLYANYATALRDGLYPYVDLGLEYPPLGLLPVWLAGLAGGGYDGYELAFGVLMLAAALVVLLSTSRLARALGGRPLVAAFAVALAPLATGAIIRSRFDLLPVAFTVLALLALVRDRPRTGFLLLGLGTMTKLFPLLLVPVAALWLLGRGQRREALVGCAIVAVVVAAVSLPFIGSGYVDAYTYHLERPVQIESVPASVLFALGGSEVTGHPVAPDRFKSNGLDGGAADAVAALFAALAVAAIGFFAARARARPDARWLVRCSLGALLAFVALGKVLSPQFVIWLVPFAALAFALRDRAVAALLTLAIVLTQVEFPARYFDLVAEDPAAIIVVAVRNAVLLGALSVILARVAAPARSPAPAAAPSR